MGRLQGKVAIVTGGASGIGRAAAALFAAEGASTIILDVTAEAGRQIEAEIAAGGGTAMFAEADVTSESSVNAAIEAGASRFGGIDVLLNCAGGSSGGDGSLVTSEPEELWRVMKLDLLGTILCCRAAIPRMVARGGGSIINMSSVVSLIGVPGLDFYTAAKGGVSALTRSLAMQHAGDAIRVNAIAPGVTMTERVLTRSGGDVSRFPLSRKQILGPAKPVDIANAALFLASDESAKITGVVLPVDGGAAAW